MATNSIKYYRVKHRMSQRDLANKLGVTSVSVWNWENGVHFPVKKKVVETLCSIFNIPLHELFVPREVEGPGKVFKKRTKSV